MTQNKEVKSEATDVVWRPGPTPPAKGSGKEIYRPELFATIEASIDGLDEKLRALSLEIHGEFLNTPGFLLPRSLWIERFPLCSQIIQS